MFINKDACLFLLKTINWTMLTVKPSISFILVLLAWFYSIHSMLKYSNWRLELSRSKSASHASLGCLCDGFISSGHLPICHWDSLRMSKQHPVASSDVKEWKYIWIWALFQCYPSTTWSLRFIKVAFFKFEVTWKWCKSTLYSHHIQSQQGANLFI